MNTSELSSNNDSLNSQKIARLQMMGIHLYESIAEIDLSSQEWLPDVCDLLKIQASDCIFGQSPIRFDPQTKQLHLPKTSTLSMLELKKAIWHAIASHVDSQ